MVLVCVGGGCSERILIFQETNEELFIHMHRTKSNRKT